MFLSTQAKTLVKTKYVELICVALLILLIIMTPPEWERMEFLFILLIPIVLSAKHFCFEYDKLKKSIVYTGIFILTSLFSYALHIWQLTWELTHPNGLFGWQIKIDPLLYAIPFNDGMWLRQFSTPVLDDLFVLIYAHGFVLCLFALVIYFILSGQPHKIVHAMFAGHFVQYLLILPFHFWVDGHQVWLIQNQVAGTQFADPIEGYRSETEPIVPSLNHVFPSMHTSIATVVIMMALREAARPVKWFFVSLNAAIIISTVYLGIHWVVDVLGGIIFGIFTFKLAERIMNITWIKNQLRLEKDRAVMTTETHSNQLSQ